MFKFFRKKPAVVDSRAPIEKWVLNDTVFTKFLPVAKKRFAGDEIMAYCYLNYAQCLASDYGSLPLGERSFLLANFIKPDAPVEINLSSKEKAALQMNACLTPKEFDPIITTSIDNLKEVWETFEGSLSNSDSQLLSGKPPAADARKYHTEFWHGRFTKVVEFIKPTLVIPVQRRN